MNTQAKKTIRIDFIIGTKAQFIKVAPIIKTLEDFQVPTRILNLSQHGDFSADVVAKFNLTTPLVTVVYRQRPVDTIPQAIIWIFAVIKSILRPHAKLRDEAAPLALIHGDTFSTVLGYFLARRLRQKVALVEAGLTSGKWFRPFPEELNRRFVERRADLLFPPNQESADLLRKKRNASCTIVNTIYNSSHDALSLAANQSGNNKTTPESFGICTLHRLETLKSRTKLSTAIKYILEIADSDGPMIFVVHPPTLKALRKHGLLENVESHPQIRTQSLTRYHDFVQQLIGAKFILTDGGSIQEESAFLEKPCIILRNETERNDGLGKTAIMTTWDATHDSNALRHQITLASSQPVKQTRLEASLLISKSSIQYVENLVANHAGAS